MADHKPLPCARQLSDTDKQLSLESNAVAFTVDWGSSKSDKENLQECFLKFRKERQREALQLKKMKKLEEEARRDPVHMNKSREKFINQLKKYFGVPYARKYWPEDSPEYNSPIFLDCCALVRKAVRDLSEEFGFYLGAWNQAYQYDTLPVTIEREEDMKPGDLVFMSGIYVNPKSKKQRHNMMHVEVWLGEGEKVIGSRWNNGKVQIFDSYKFQPKSFHSEQYHFKSIDTWLMGICRSYCPEHPWRKYKFLPGRKSIFSVDDDEDFINADPDDVDDDNSETQNSKNSEDPQTSTLPLPFSSKSTAVENVCCQNGEKQTDNMSEYLPAEISEIQITNDNQDKTIKSHS